MRRGRGGTWGLDAAIAACVLALCAVALSSARAQPTSISGAAGDRAQLVAGAVDPSDHGAAPRDVLEVEDITELDLEALLAVPVVRAASRREQSWHEAPASVSLISSDEIRALALTSPAEALSLVPGLDVLRMDERVYLVGMRGYNGLDNNRVLVLLDGRSMIDASPTQTVPWDLLPVHHGELERIEVLRGPGSTLYGANALSGVVSLRTRRALEHPGFEAEAAGLMYALPDLPSDFYPDARQVYSGAGYLAHGWRDSSERVAVRLSASFGQPPVLFPVLDPATTKPYPGRRVAGRLALDLRSGEHGRSELDLAVVRQSAPEAFVLNRSDLRRQELSFRGSHSEAQWLHGLLGWELAADARLQTSEQVAGPVDTVSLAPRMWQGHGRLALHWTPPGRRARLVTAGDLTLDGTDYGTEQVSRRYMAALLDGEVALDPARRYLLTGGLRMENVRVQRAQADSILYRKVNWRGGLVYRPAPRHDLRLLLATAYRIPNVFQSLTGQVDTLESLQLAELPVSRIWVPRPDLPPERLSALELGYRASPRERLLFELTLALQRMDGIILRHPHEGTPFYYEDWQDQDSASLELELDAWPLSWLHTRVSYCFTAVLSQRVEDVGRYFHPIWRACLRTFTCCRACARTCWAATLRPSSARRSWWTWL